MVWAGGIGNRNEHRHTTKQSVKFTPVAFRTDKHVQSVPTSGKRIVPVPVPCWVQEEEGTGAEDLA